MIEFKLPALGADMDEGKLLEWKIRPGDVVERGQIVAVVDTSKAAVDVECWQPGTVWRLLVEPATTITVGTTMALLLEAGEQPPAAEPEPPATPPQPAHEPEAILPTAPPVNLSASTSASRPRMSPAARRRARELGVDPASVAITKGPDAVISIEDVERAAGQSAVTSVSSAGGEPMRATIAQAMSRSKREIPHYYLLDTIPLARASAWLTSENAGRPVTGRLLMVALLLRAVGLCLRRFPEFNGHYSDGAFQPAENVHLGVAIALRGGGLVAPALLNIQDQSLDEVMAGLTDLITRSRAGSLRASELSAGTATVTPLGEQSVDAVQGVIYPPQVALIGFGKLARRPWVDANGDVIAVPTVQASLAADHRVSDGQRGARFLAALAAALQKPEEL